MDTKQVPVGVYALPNYWTPELVDGLFGKYVCENVQPEDSESLGYLCSITYQVGYIVGSSHTVTLVSICDGMVIRYQKDDVDARQVFADSLNESQFGYRVLSNKDVSKRLQHLLD